MKHGIYDAYAIVNEGTEDEKMLTEERSCAPDI